MKKLISLIFIICIISTLVGCFSIQNTIQEDGEESTAETRSARNSDLDNVNIIFPTYRSVTVRFVPKSDIEGLKLKIMVYDKNEYLLDSTIKTVGDVIEGQQYVVDYQLTTNNVNEGKKIETCEVSVYSGSVSYTLNSGFYYTSY